MADPPVRKPSYLAGPTTSSVCIALLLLTSSCDLICLLHARILSLPKDAQLAAGSVAQAAAELEEAARRGAIGALLVARLAAWRQHALTPAARVAPPPSRYRGFHMKSARARVERGSMKSKGTEK